MIKINLLPPNLFEGKIIRNIAIGFGVLALVVAGGMLFWNSTIVKHTQQVQTEADRFKQLTEQANQIKSEADAMRAGIAPITQKVKFFQDVAQHNLSYLEVYHEIGRYTYKRVVYNGVSLSDDGAVKLDVAAPSMSDIARYMLNLYTATSLFSSVVMGGAPAAGAGPASTTGPSMAALPPASGTMGAPGAAPTAATAGINAVTLNQSKAASAFKTNLTFTITCALTDDWKKKMAAPAPPGAVSGPAN